MLVTSCSLPGRVLLVWVGREGDGEGLEEAVDQVDATDNRLEKKHKIVPKKGR